MQRENIQKPTGSAVLENCEKLVLNCVSDVTEFDEQAITLSSELGVIEIRGENMKIKSFDNSDGTISVEGYIYALVYRKDKKSQGFFAKVFK